MTKQPNWYSLQWGIPTTNDTQLFELLTIGVFQAGLSWQVVTAKRETFHKHFANYDIATVAGMMTDNVESMLADPTMIRNERKIRAVITNAQQLILLRREGISFSDFLWAYFPDGPLIVTHDPLEKMPTTHPLATTIAKVLKKRGFKFVGPVITCMFLKAAGMIQDYPR